MKKVNFSRPTILGFCIALFMFASAMHTFGQGDPIVTTLPVRVMATQAVIPASGSMLVRTNNGVFMTLTTQGLVPGTVATVWFAIFNTPAACATNPCTPVDLDNPATHGGLFNNGGRIVGADGSATFGGFRAIGDETGRERGTRGLILPRTAEIHLVVRTHGPAILNDPMVLSQQLSMFNGGCPPNTCTTIQASVHQQ